MVTQRTSHLAEDRPVSTCGRRMGCVRVFWLVALHGVLLCLGVTAVNYQGDEWTLPSLLFLLGINSRSRTGLMSLFQSKYLPHQRGTGGQFASPSF